MIFVGVGLGGALHRVNTNKKTELQQTLAVHDGYIFDTSHEW
jgi:hypothetical protein